MNCTRCNKPLPEEHYHLTFGNSVAYTPDRSGSFCSRACLIEFTAPRIKEAVSVKQWVPTPEEEERMRQ